MTVEVAKWLIERWDVYRKDTKEMFDQFDRCLNLAKEMEAGAEHPRSGWFKVDVNPALDELWDLAAFRWTTPLGTLGGREPGDLVKILKTWAAIQEARFDENLKRLKGVTS